MNWVPFLLAWCFCGLYAIWLAQQRQQKVSWLEGALYLALGPVVLFAAMISKRD